MTILMQTIGVLGSLILLTLSGDHPLIHETVLRFMFDAFGLLALIAAAWITRQSNHDFISSS
jgi:hypothetical protein